MDALYGIAASPGRYMAVGTNGAMVTSEDAYTWSRLPPVTDQELRGTAWAGGVWLAVGASGTVLRSLDGERWEPVHSGRRRGAVVRGLRPRRLDRGGRERQVVTTDAAALYPIGSFSNEGAIAYPLSGTS